VLFRRTGRHPNDFGALSKSEMDSIRIESTDLPIQDDGAENLEFRKLDAKQFCPRDGTFFVRLKHETAHVCRASLLGEF
jgi:hypothetical protein